MPAVIDTPEHSTDIAYVEAPAVLVERPQARAARPGFWRTLTHRITKRLIHRSHERHVPTCRVHRPFETPMDRLVRENPSLSLHALSLI